MGGGVLDNKTGIALHALVHLGLFHGPLADVGPLLLIITASILLRMGGLPTGVPAVGELLEELGLDVGGLVSKHR